MISAYSGTLTLPNLQLEIMFKFPYHALARLNALSRTNSSNLATAKWIPILISSQCNFTITPQREDANEYGFQKSKK